MNHDYAHCADYKKDVCSKECFRGELVRDLSFHPTLRLCVSWMNFKGTKDCMLEDPKDE